MARALAAVPCRRTALRAADIRTNSPAASSNGSRSPARLSASRGSSSSTSRRPGSTCHQARILEEIDRLRRERGVAVVYVSHDLAVVGSLADRIAVMYAGRIVEEGPAAALLARPHHPYTRGLLGSVPDPGQPRRLESIPGVAVGSASGPTAVLRTALPSADRRPGSARDAAARGRRWGHRVRCFEWARTPPRPAGAGGPAPSARRFCSSRLSAPSIAGARTPSWPSRTCPSRLRAVSASPSSGSRGAARRRSRVHRRPPFAHAGRVVLDGALAPRAADRPREARRRIQIVFQNPNDSLNPRHRVGDAIARPARVLRDPRVPRRRRPRGSSSACGSPRAWPSASLESSRAASASGSRSRALAAQPDLVVCDEITSALDVSVQAAVLELLAELRAELLALLFITHDLGVVASVGDRVLVLEDGVCLRRRARAGTSAIPSTSTRAASSRPLRACHG